MPERYEYSEGFQFKILALMARDRGFYVVYKDIIKPKYFKSAVHMDMVRIVHEHYDREMERAKQKGTEVNPPTTEVLWEEVRKLTKHNARKKELKDIYTDTVLDIYEQDLSDAEYIKDSVVEFGKTRAIEEAILSSMQELEKENTDYEIIEDSIRTAVKVGEDISDLGIDYFENAEERMQTYSEGIDGVERIPTGLSGIDRVTGGGLGRGELGVVIAPPNRGKSFALTNIGAGGVSRGYNVFHYTLEMPEKQVARRYDNKLLLKDFNYLKEFSEKALVALKNLQSLIKGQLIIKKYRTNECSVDTLRSHITQVYMQKGIKPDVIIVDYADLLKPRRNYGDKRFELESIYLDLRDLGDEFDCPVWTASQANRGALDKKVITIADLAEAFNKANIADFMVALCQTIEEKDDDIMRWHVAKQRQGQANMTLEGDIDYLTANMTVLDEVVDSD
ncbi:replicative DNA helicase [Exiguobacterium phage vB_EalM-132]|nr:replicative DNA helicase [Exiguobacterium phage vB_EalM-132]